MPASASAAAVRSARQALGKLAGAIEILEYERDLLITLVVEGPLHLRSRRFRRLVSIERRLLAAQDARDNKRRILGLANDAEKLADRLTEEAVAIQAGE